MIELAPGMFETLGIEAGDRIDISKERLELLGTLAENEDEPRAFR